MEFACYGRKLCQSYKIHVNKTWNSVNAVCSVNMLYNIEIDLFTNDDGVSSSWYQLVEIK